MRCHGEREGELLRSVQCHFREEEEEDEEEQQHIGRSVGRSPARPVVFQCTSIQFLPESAHVRVRRRQRRR